MKKLPVTENPIVLRTDFSNQRTWETICAIIATPVGEFRAYVEFISDPDYTGASNKQLLGLLPEHYTHNFIIIADGITISRPDTPLLIIDLSEIPGREFRAIPSQIQSIENNLSIANMGFDEFLHATNDDGVFRGFPET